MRPHILCLTWSILFVYKCMFVLKLLSVTCQKYWEGSLLTIVLQYIIWTTASTRQPFEALEVESHPFLAWYNFRFSFFFQQTAASVVEFCTSPCATHFQWGHLVPAPKLHSCKMCRMLTYYLFQHCAARISRGKKTSSGWLDMLFQNLYVPSSTNGAITDVQVTHAVGTTTIPSHHRCYLSDFVLVRI